MRNLKGKNAFVPKMVDRGFGRIVNLSSGIMDQPELEQGFVASIS